MRRTALVIDMIHPDADRPVPSVREALPAVLELTERARAAGAPVVYVNDNFGSWRSDQAELVRSALAAHIRHLDVCVPPDAVAHIHRDLADASLRMMSLNTSAEVCPAEEVSF